jgi:hypothetical protein
VQRRRRGLSLSRGDHGLEFRASLLDLMKLLSASKKVSP